MRIFLLCLALIAPWVTAEVYKTVDKDGRTVYTDKPKNGKRGKAATARDQYRARCTTAAQFIAGGFVPVPTSCSQLPD